MISVEMSEQDWRQLMLLLGNNVVWAQANPYLMRISEALERHHGVMRPPYPQTNSGHYAAQGTEVQGQ